MREFIREGQDGVWAMLAGRGGRQAARVVASTAAMPQALGYQAADAGRSAMLKYDLRTGRLLKRYDLKPEGGIQQS